MVKRYNISGLLIYKIKFPVDFYCKTKLILNHYRVPLRADANAIARAAKSNIHSASRSALDLFI